MTRNRAINRRWIVKANRQVCKSDTEISAFKIERKCSEIMIIPFAPIRSRRRLYLNSILRFYIFFEFRNETRYIIYHQID